LVACQVSYHVIWYFLALEL